MAGENLESRVLGYDFAGLGQDGFAALLAEEAKIAVPRAKVVTREYLRFVYLTQIAQGALTPSKIVDAAWHVHLTRTRDYWEVLCKDVLGKALHHDAATGAAANLRHTAQYAKTRALYKATFGEAAPAHVWPDAPAETTQNFKDVLIALGGGAALIYGIITLDGQGRVFLVAGGAIALSYGVSRMFKQAKSPRKSTSNSNCAAACSGGYTPSGKGIWATMSDGFGGGDSDGGGSSCGSSCGGGGD